MLHQETDCIFQRFSFIACAQPQRRTLSVDFITFRLLTIPLWVFHSFNLKIRLNLWFGWFHGTLCLTSMRILKRLWSYGRFLKRHAEKIFIKNVKGFTRVWKNRFYFCKMIMCEYTLIPEWWRVLYNMIQCVDYQKIFYALTINQ